MAYHEMTYIPWGRFVEKSHASWHTSLVVRRTEQSIYIISLFIIL